MGLFISFEGPEGSGKSTQIQMLTQRLSQAGYEVLATREPGGTAIGDSIRAILLDADRSELLSKTEIFLFNAARAQLVEQVIRPALLAGKVVLCDRYADSTLAYQGYGRRQDLAKLRRLCHFATGGLTPARTIYLDLEPHAGLTRKQKGLMQEWNRMEAEPLAFHETVRHGFLSLAAAEPDRWAIVDASQDVELVQKAIWQCVAQLLNPKKDEE